jgi:two-component system LytT family sensor kinase
MNWYSFIFSQKKSHRLVRHLSFWLLWWIYFTASFYHYEQSGLQKIAFEPWNGPFFIKSLLLLFIHIISCYYFINYLMPQYLLKARYAALIVQVVFLGIVILFSCYFIYNTIVPIVNSSFHANAGIVSQNIWWTSITAGLLSAPKVISAAAAGKLLKRWWQKQKEKERLEKEKLVTDLQLLKAQMHPEFLFTSLDNIYSLTQEKASAKASMLLLKLADILSYMLYDCDNKFVLLEKEIKVIKDYLALEKMVTRNSLEIDIAVKGKAGNKAIVPLLFFSLIENCVSYIKNKKLEQNWLNLEFQIEAGEVTMRLIHGKSNESLDLPENENSIAKARKKLDFFYPGKYELKVTVEEEMMMTYLRVTDKELIPENRKSIYTSDQLVYDIV